MPSGSARTRAGQVRLAGILDYVVDIFYAGFQAAFGVIPLLFRDTEWNTIPRTGWLPRVIAVGRGLVLVLPLLLLFGGLLMAADAVYSHLVSQALHFDTGALVSHLFLTGLWAWLFAGFGRGLLLANPPVLPSEKRPSLPSLGVVETATILGLLNLLFLSFVLVQFRYMFGGSSLVQAMAGLTYTQYARSGFFELVWVAALVLPLLLGLHWLQRPDDARAQRLFSWQAAVQVALLFVIMASALMRMRLYQEACGQTEACACTQRRLWAGWPWFSSGSASPFCAASAAVSPSAQSAAFCLVFALHIVNPDATIVRANLAHAQKGHTFDADYAATLSADAAPILADALPSLPPLAQGKVSAHLLRNWSHGGDWRSWSLSRALAFRAVDRNRPLLLTDQKYAPPAPTEGREDD